MKCLRFFSYDINTYQYVIQVSCVDTKFPDVKIDMQILFCVMVKSWIELCWCMVITDWD